MLEIMQNSHSLLMADFSRNIRPLELHSISFKCINVVGENNNLITSTFMKVDQILT
jgi:hypothetical protein